MKRSIALLPLLILMIVAVTGCDFLGGVFKTGVGVGIFIVVVIIILIFLISRIGRRNRL